MKTRNDGRLSPAQSNTKKKETPQDQIKARVRDMIEEAEKDLERQKMWKSKRKKDAPSFLQKSQDLLDVFRARNTAENVKKLKLELQSFQTGNKSSGFSFTLALMQVRKEIEEREA